MEPRFESVAERKFVGIKSRSSLRQEAEAFLLWRQFMPRRKEIQKIKGAELYALTIYPAVYFERYDPESIFEKWAAVEVEEVNGVPEEMDAIEIPAGLYAVFTYKGPPSEAFKAFEFIFRDWLPRSGCVLDHRPHMAVMGEKYHNTKADSEEEFWIPVTMASGEIRY